MVNTPATQAGAPLAMPLCSFIYSSRPAPSQRPASDSTLDHVQRVGGGWGAFPAGWGDHGRLLGRPTRGVQCWQPLAARGGG